MIDSQQLASGKERCSKANLFQTRSYPDAKLLRIANLHDSLVNLSQSRIESEAELNHHGDVRTSHTTDQSSSKYFEVWAIVDFRKLWRGSCWHLKKTRFLLAQTMSKLVDIYKRQVTGKLTTSFHPSLRDKEATWTPLIQQADSEPELSLNRPQQV